MEGFRSFLSSINVVDFFTNVALGLLAIDTARAILAMLGWVPRETKFWGRVIYGVYDKQLVVESLRELGFTRQQGEEIKKELQKVPENIPNRNGITSENAVQNLIALLAKYIVRFDNPIQYGGEKLTNSSYYIDTMEMSHDEDDKQKMVYIMSFLYASVNKDNKKPDVIATPKGGNPLFALECAHHYSSEFLMIKSTEDKSRVITSMNTADDFDINYEGSRGVKKRGANKKTQKCIVLDCNTSGGSQLIQCVQNLSNIAVNYTELHLQAPDSVFVLFRADSDKSDIDQNFKDNHCTLFRYFDLSEDVKQKIYELKISAEKESRYPDIYFYDDKKAIDEIIRTLKDSGRYYYKVKGASA